MAAVLRLLTAENDTNRQAAMDGLRGMMGDGTQPVKQVDVEAEVRKILLEVGAPDHLTGHRYVVSAILMAIEEPKYVSQITGKLYPELAEKFETTPSRIERGIRHLVEVAWTRCDLETLDFYFGNTVSAGKGKPTNGEFIARLANATKLQMRR